MIGKCFHADTAALAAAPSAVFLFDLIQDVSVLRPIVRTLAEETGVSLIFLMSRQFEGRDKVGTWRAEIADLAAETQARVERFDSPFAAVTVLQGGRGLIFSASESNLPAHAVNHHVFLSAPAGYTRITVQHGYECVGFNQNREQTLAHGGAVRFAADVLCGWVPLHELRHLCASERDKYVELGPPMVLNRLFDRSPHKSGPQTGLICENLHSVRMRTTGDFQQVYLDTLLAFARAQGAAGRNVALRPHPGGQFVIKNKIELPANLGLANKPMYKTALAGFDYGISAPSSVLIDMVLAGIPTAVWTDGADVLDTSAYADLARVNSVQDWIDFAEAATADPAPFRARQAEFLERTGLGVSPDVVRRRLLALVTALLGTTGTARERGRATSPRRVLLVANGVIPTLHISFLKPLAELEASGAVEISIITEKEVLQARGKGGEQGDGAAADYARTRVEAARPDIAVFCRYSGPEVEAMVSRLHQSGVPVIFHIDDDLLNVPKEIGEKKHAEHNRIERTSTIRYLLDNADFVYCSTPRLKERFRELGVVRDLYAGDVYCCRGVVSPAREREVQTIGFMGNDKTPELAMLVPVIGRALKAYPWLRFELFGSMAMPDELAIFGERIRAMPPIGDYDAFVAAFQDLRWDIGLCPLHPTPFNVVKADTKWVDYTSIGAAVIASRGTAYDACCSGGCGLLVDDLDQWSAAIDRLVTNPKARYEQVVAAQARLRDRYAPEHLTAQVLAVFDAAARRERAFA